MHMQMSSCSRHLGWFGNKANYDRLLQQIKDAWLGPATSLFRSAHHELLQQIKHAWVGPAISLPCNACMHVQMLHSSFTSHVQGPMRDCSSSSCASRLHIIFSRFQGAQLAEKLDAHALFFIHMCMNECIKHTYCFTCMHNTFAYMNARAHTLVFVARMNARRTHLGFSYMYT
jgi:hypothetical protein